MTTKDLLEEEVNRIIQNMNLFDVGSKEHTYATDNVVKLCDRIIAFDKADVEFYDSKVNEEIKKKQLEIDELKVQKNAELKLDENQLESYKFNEDHKLRVKEFSKSESSNKIRLSIDIAAIVIPTFVSVWGIVKSIKFEETGTFTTIVGRGLINKLIPKK